MKSQLGNTEVLLNSFLAKHKCYFQHTCFHKHVMSPSKASNKQYQSTDDGKLCLTYFENATITELSGLD